jgi:RNA polymerase sigma-70 factor (ECF subfamily)
MDPSNSLQERRERFEALAAEVFEPLQRYLRRRANADEAEEAFGDTLLALWRRLDDIPPAATLPWSYGVARRVLANRRRGLVRQRQLVERIGRLTPVWFDPDPSAAPEYPELAAALRALREEDREVLTLWAWEQLEPREIAIVLGVSVNAATLRLSKAKKRLAQAMSGQSGAGAGHMGVEYPRSADG